MAGELLVTNDLLNELQRRGYNARLTPGSGDTDVMILDNAGRLVGLLEVKANMFGSSGNWRYLYEAIGQVLYHGLKRDPVPPLAICGFASARHPETGAPSIEDRAGFGEAERRLATLGISVIFADDDAWHGLSDFLARGCRRSRQGLAEIPVFTRIPLAGRFVNMVS